MHYSACIAVASASCFTLVLLFTLRRIFIKHRRAKFAHPFLPSSSFLSPGPCPYLRTASLGGIFLTDGKAGIEGGFWIGLLGSPTWEATIWSRADKASRKQSQQLSFTYQLHTDSRRRRSQSRHGSSSSRTGTSSKTSADGNKSALDSSDTDIQRRHHSFSPPACPSKALAKSERRLSLPSMSNSDSSSGETSMQRRHSSLKSVRGMKRQLQEASSVRLVNSETVLPLAYVSPTSSCRAIFQSRLVSTPAPPLPPLPTASNPRRNLYISHPYALMPLSASPLRRGKDDDRVDDYPAPRPLQLPDLANHYVSNRTWDSNEYQQVSSLSQANAASYLAPIAPSNNHVFDNTWDSLAPKSRSSVDPESVALSTLDHTDSGDRKPLSPILSTINSFPSIEIALPSPTFSPPLYAMPTLPTPLRPVPIPITKHMAKPKKVRARRSLPVGPSPLRTMILPDSSSGCISDPKHRSDESKENTPPEMPGARQHQSAIRHNSLPVVVEESFDEAMAMPALRQSRQSFKSESEDEESTNALLGMIRELVQATSEWDGSIALDDKFKAMVESADPADSSSSSAGSGPVAGSCEIDLGLLGLDRFGGFVDAPRDYELEGASADSAGDLSRLGSLWDEGGCAWRESVGLAW